MKKPCSIIGVAFSKDRAMQLDATLRSFFARCRDAHLISMRVIFTGSTDQYRSQYDQLKAAYPSVRFIDQADFKQDVFSALEMPATFWQKFSQKCSAVRRDRYVLFLVDDNQFVRDFSLADACGILERERDALAYAFQLGTNLTYSFALNLPVTFPDHEKIDSNTIKYRWADARPGWNYPLEVSSSIYRREQCIDVLRDLEFTNPNQLEAKMFGKCDDYRKSHPHLLCPETSVTFCNPMNMVQREYENRAGNQVEHSIEELANLFDQGRRIDVESFKGFTPISAHQVEDVSYIEDPS